MGLNFAGMITPTSVPFYGIVPGKATMPLGQITLPVTFGTPANYCIEFIKFEVADFKSLYHAILGWPVMAKFMAIPNYPYLLLEMPGPHDILSLRDDLKCAFDCDVQAIQIVAKTQAADERKEVATIAEEMNPEELEIPAKRPISSPHPKKQISNISICRLVIPPRQRSSALTSPTNRNSRSPTFSDTIKISSLGSRPTCQVSRESWLSTKSISMKVPNLLSNDCDASHPTRRQQSRKKLQN
jgi:hypothetical protein